MIRWRYPILSLFVLATPATGVRAVDKEKLRQAVLKSPVPQRHIGVEGLGKQRFVEPPTGQDRFFANCEEKP